ncbi:tyrosine-type recombinase/integrase [Synechococcus elongatus]|uniref:tyrosine-type recombinase/integrase n=1 Tax=Synechococcus elongatus TaxID=32046 RepID=UPI000F7E2551|nr:tyrosine-type recombinase/integrase [Synechococcus elongatus]
MKSRAIALSNSTELAPSLPADSWETVLALWTHGRSPHTQRYYRQEAQAFRQWVQKPLDQVTLADLQSYLDRLDQLPRGDRARLLRHSPECLQASSRRRTVAVLKSLFSFLSKRLGIVPVNVAAAIHAPRVKDTLAERILSESIVQSLIAAAGNERDRLILQVLYGAGLRVSELCHLRWQDVKARSPEAGQLTVLGKGGKTRVVLLPRSLWQTLSQFRQGAELAAPVFCSRRGTAISASQVHRIVRQAALQVAELEPEIAQRVSPHWLRHCHASHSLQQGASVALVSRTLGHSSVAITSNYLHCLPDESSALFLDL